MQELGINSTAYETQSKKGTKRKCRSKEHDNGTGNDEIERDLSDDDDVEYDPEMEEDKGEMEDKAEKQTDNAAPIQEEDEMMSAPQTQGGLQVRTTTSEIVSHVPKKRQARGPTKGIVSNMNDPMHLEYNQFGQPCGKWRMKYGTQVGICMRKLSILAKWSEVSEGLKKALWEDTMVSVEAYPSIWLHIMYNILVK
ncbi:uncharacterized protein LOC130590979 [Beta vulgaris subsp. vulgaris]|uniref:uncharacterized protein LOC130590979 n=1 Tax=Beta vulgaris subsp. vulgaris TaxID=3555 RepID=UPI0025491C84|nr:uncharacterized protein LOC130590979 [Beta vulgaris subsp. vulgaris]